MIIVPINLIQIVSEDDHKAWVTASIRLKNLRDDWLEIRPQDYLSEKAKLAVAEYILTLKK